METVGRQLHEACKALKKAGDMAYSISLALAGNRLLASPPRSLLSPPPLPGLRRCPGRPPGHGPAARIHASIGPPADQRDLEAGARQHRTAAAECGTLHRGEGGGDFVASAGLRKSQPRRRSSTRKHRTATSDAARPCRAGAWHRGVSGRCADAPPARRLLHRPEPVGGCRRVPQVRAGTGTDDA